MKTFIFLFDAQLDRTRLSRFLDALEARGLPRIPPDRCFAGERGYSRYDGPVTDELKREHWAVAIEIDQALLETEPPLDLPQSRAFMDWSVAEETTEESIPSFREQ